MVSTNSVNGQIGKALDFDGSDDYIDCGNDSSLDITDEITIEAWVKENNRVQTAKIASRRSSSAFYFFGVDTGNPYGGIGDGTDYDVTGKTFSIPLNEWHHLVFVFVDAEDKGYIYYDGVLKETSVLDYSIGNLSGVKLSIGADEEGTGNKDAQICQPDICSHEQPYKP